MYERSTDKNPINEMSINEMARLTWYFNKYPKLEKLEHLVWLARDNNSPDLAMYKRALNKELKKINW